MKKIAPSSSPAGDTKKELVRIRRFSQITLPSDACEHFHLDEGDYLELSIVEKGILLRPVKVVLKKSPKKRSAGTRVQKKKNSQPA